jgi:ribosomal protein S4
MPKEQTLVDYLVEVGPFSKTFTDASIARRLIVEERVEVNGEIITDPSFRLPFGEGFVIHVNRNS